MNHMFAHRRSTAEREHDVDLTPMLDVIFIMLIFFIVTASFVKESGVEMTKEQTAQNMSESDAPQDIIFRITSNNEVWLGERRIDIESVRANVERMYAENPKARVIIRANEQSQTKTTIQIVDASREAGIYDIGFTAVER